MMRVAFANLGAEEGPPSFKPDTPPARLARAFVSMIDDPPWRWLADARGLIPWIRTPEADRRAQELRIAAWGPEMHALLRCHRKSYAIAKSIELGLVDDVLAPLLVCLGGEFDRERIERHVAHWPPWAREDFLVKPDVGTSGRGRVAGRRGRLSAGFEGASARLRSCGAVLEPWLRRLQDVSSQWLIDEHGEPHHLGNTLQVVRGAGVYRGCDIVRRGGRYTCGLDLDEELIEKTRPLVEAAAADGLRGPCGVDAFTWALADDVRLRAVVELNARFTAGTVALALAERRGLREGQRAQLRLDREELLRVE